jgi:hypothetical protein
MIKELLFGLATTLMLTAPTLARTHHHKHSGQHERYHLSQHYQSRHRGAERNHAKLYRAESRLASQSIAAPALASYPWTQHALHYLGGNPTGWGHAWCARFLRMVMPYDPGPRYNLAANWRVFGAPSGPYPGAIAVMPHHVGIVLQSGGNRVLLVSGNHGHRVGIGWYPTGRIIAYRRPRWG